MKSNKPAIGLLAASLALLLLLPLGLRGSNIDENEKWAWSENSGWMDFRPEQGGVTVYDTHLEGYAYSSRIGWVKLGSGAETPYGNNSYEDWGVNNDGDGNLSGWGWVANAGWIDFSSGDYPEQVMIDSEGNFSGFAWSEKVGWVNFSSLGEVDYRVKTEWTPAKKIQIETAADGSETVVGEELIASGDQITVYAITRDDNNNFKENVAATWSLVDVVDGVVQGDLVDNQDGSATFTGNLIGEARIKAEYEELEAIPSGLITVTFGDPAELAIVQQPGGATAGEELDPQPKVVVRDAAGNTVSDSDDQITASIESNPPGDGILSGDTEIPASAGEAQFSDLKIDKAGVGYTLKFTGAGLESLETDPFNISAGPPTQLVFHVGPSNADAGEAISPAVKVWILDAEGNLTSADNTVTIALDNDPHGGTLSGTKNVEAEDGEAEFDDLWIDRAGDGYTLRATAGGLSDAVSGSFEITVGPAAQLAFDQQPTETTAGESIDPAVTVRIEDSQGNLTASTAEVTVAIENNAGGGTLDGTKTVEASGGVATFSNLSIDKAGVEYTLKAVADGPVSDISDAFDIVAGSAVKLAFDQQPTETKAGVAISPAVTVRIEDTLGNLVESAGDMVTMAIENNAAGDGELSGTLEVAASAGVATFDNLKINRPGVDYTLKATSGGLAPDTSAAFNIEIGDPARLAFLVQPSTATVGEIIAPAVKVRIEDSEGNLTASEAEVTIAIEDDPSGGNISGTIPKEASAGMAEFDDLVIDTPGTGYTLKATADDLDDAVSARFNINPLGTGNIHWEDKWAWNENSGWLDFRPPAGGVMVYDTHLEGLAYSSKIGWVKLGSGGGNPETAPYYGNNDYADWGVNNDGEGNLSGWGWVANVGWINFSSGDYPKQVVIDSDGNFSGYAFSEKVGWVNFSSLGEVEYKVSVMDGPDIVSISCFEDSSHTVEIVEATWQNVGTVSFAWTDPETPEGDTFYYLYNDTADPSIASDGSNAEGTVTTAHLNDYELPEEGSRYFHVRPRNSYGQWGEERVFNVWYDGSGPGPASGGASGTHTLEVWSNNPVIEATWEAAEDEFTAVAGYSILWDTAPDTLPDSVQDKGAEERSSTSPAQSTSDSIHLHIRAVDELGNWSDQAYHYGPFSVDVDPPGEVSDLAASAPHAVETWSNQSAVTFTWTEAEDIGSGIDGYATGIDTSPSGWLGDEKDVDAGVGEKTVHFPDGDGNYFHIRALDNAGNWSETAAGLGPYWIDTVAPDIPAVTCWTDSSQTEPVPEAFWKAETTPYFTWDEPVSDSPIVGYRYSLNQELSGEFAYTETFVDYSGQPLEEGQHIFRVQAKDLAGNEGAVKTFHLYVGEAETPVIRLVLLLHGYLDEESLVQRETLVNLEFREEIGVSTTYYYDVSLDSSGIGEVPLSGLPADSYYVLARHKLLGETFDGDPIPLGAPHLPVISGAAVALSTEEVVEINFSDTLSGNFVEAYQSPKPEASSPMIEALGHEGRYLMLGGGNADGNDLINVLDILKWDTLVGFPDSDHRGGERFSDEGNFNGDDVIDGHDFNVWKRMQSLGVTYAPLP